MEINYLPGICKLEFLNSTSLTIYPKQKLYPGAKVHAIGAFTKLPLVGNASLTYANEDTDAGTVYVTVVSGTLFDREDIPQSTRDELINGKFAYKATDLHKNSYLVGCDKKPFPTIVFTPNNDRAPSGIRAIDFTISWRSTLPPLEIIAL